MVSITKFTSTLLVVAVVSMMGCSPKPIPEPPPSTTAKSAPTGATPKDADATPAEVAEALAWGKENLLPVISKGMKDPEPKVAVLIKHLVAMAQSSVQITMGAQRDGPGLAWTNWSKELHKPRIYLAVPELRQYQVQLTSDQFRDMLLAILCHETIHLELRMPTPDDPKGSSTEGRAIALDAEARAWYRTVVEVIRPFRKAGRYISSTARNADKALKARGNHDNQAWRDWVSSNLVSQK